MCAQKVGEHPELIEKIEVLVEDSHAFLHSQPHFPTHDLREGFRKVAEDLKNPDGEWTKPPHDFKPVEYEE